ncbi:MAG: DUF423 domain-containing protein [Methylococcales bacterium]|nr:DUF423 domain-containing protein [Methylococcales bacterium]
MRSPFLLLATLSALCAVVLGAFGAHGLQAILSLKMLAIYKTAVTYQMWHALGLGLIAIFKQQTPNSKLLEWSGWLMFVGIGLFSGSLYLLSVLNLKWLGMITPLGGVAFIIAWILFAIYAAQKDLSKG